MTQRTTLNMAIQRVKIPSNCGIGGDSGDGYGADTKISLATTYHNRTLGKLMLILDGSVIPCQLSAG